MRVKFALLTTEPITISPHVLRPTFWAFAARIGLTSLFDSDSDADINITECECHPLRAPSAARDSRMRASSRSPQTTKCVLNTSPVTGHQRTRYGINVSSALELSELWASMRNRCVTSPSPSAGDESQRERVVRTYHLRRQLQRASCSRYRVYE